MLDPDVVSFAVVSLVIVGLVGSLVAIGIAGFRALQRPRRSALPSAPRDDDRIAQLQQSVDAIAVEIERIAEAQRFSTRLLAERAGEPVAVRDERD